MNITLSQLSVFNFIIENEFILFIILIFLSFISALLVDKLFIFVFIQRPFFVLQEYKKYHEC